MHPALFSLLDYTQARRQATKIARAVSTGHMPPWLPEPNDPAFIGERRLSPEAVATIRDWEKAGAPEGPRDRLAASPVLRNGWALGEPDEQRYYRYVVARLAAFSNVMWDITNEWHLFRDEAWVDRMGALVKEADPYDHVASVHGNV